MDHSHSDWREIVPPSGFAEKAYFNLDIKTVKSMQPDLGAGNNLQLIQYQFSRSVVSDFLQPHGRSTPGLPVHCQLLEFTQTHVH